MSHEHENHEPPELRIVEQALAGLAPAAPRIDRDRLMFLAGQASSGREPRADANLAKTRPIGKLSHPARLLWPATSAALAATSLALAIALVNRPAPAERIVYRDREVIVADAAPSLPVTTPPLTKGPPKALSTASATLPADNYVRTRDLALRLGLDALGNAPRGGGDRETPTPTARSLLESLLPAEPGRSAPSPESTHM